MLKTTPILLAHNYEGPNLSRAQAWSVPLYSQPSKMTHSYFWVSRTAFSWGGSFLLHYVTSPCPAAQASSIWWLVVQEVKQKLQDFKRPVSGSHMASQSPYSVGESWEPVQIPGEGKNLLSIKECEELLVNISAISRHAQGKTISTGVSLGYWDRYLMETLGVW